MKKCQSCNGNKTVLGMGNMREDCKPCSGKGFMPEVEPIKVTAEHIKEKTKEKAKNERNDK